MKLLPSIKMVRRLFHPCMKLIDRYIISRYIITFFFIMGLIIAIVVLVDFVEKIDDFIEKKPPVYEIIFVYYVNFIPFFANLLTPICIFLSVIFFTSQMAQRSELIPLLGSGVSFYRILAPYLVASAIMAGLSFYFKAYVVPNATERRMDFEYQYMYAQKRRISGTSNIHKKVSQDFYTVRDENGGEREEKDETYIYIKSYNDKNHIGYNFTLERIKAGDIVCKIIADKISWVDTSAVWRLSNARFREFIGDRERMYKRREVDTTFLLTPDDIFIREMKAESMPMPELVRYIDLEEMRGSDILEELYIEKYRRYSDPVAVIILTLIGFAMSSRKSRGGIALQIGLGLAICFGYILLLFAGQALLSGGSAVTVFLMLGLAPFVWGYRKYIQKNKTEIARIVGMGLALGVAALGIYHLGAWISTYELPIWVGVWLPNIIFFPVGIMLIRVAPK